MHRQPIIGLRLLGLAGCASSPRLAQTRVDEALRSGVCCVHRVPMQMNVTPIVYGLVFGPFGAARDAQAFEFPFAYRHMNGGCVVSDESPFSMTIYVCSECDSAKKQWIHRHPSDQWATWWKAEMEEEPNKSLEPTPTSVTPPADAGAAPAAVVAHL